MSRFFFPPLPGPTRLPVLYNGTLCPGCARVLFDILSDERYTPDDDVLDDSCPGRTGYGRLVLSILRRRKLWNPPDPDDWKARGGF